VALFPPPSTHLDGVPGKALDWLQQTTKMPRCLMMTTMTMTMSRSFSTEPRLHGHVEDPHSGLVVLALAKMTRRTRPSTPLPEEDYVAPQSVACLPCPRSTV
jgi:hypothetical protein